MMDDQKIDFICGWRRQNIDSRCQHPIYREFLLYVDRMGAYDDDYYRYCNTFSAMLLNDVDFIGKKIREIGKATRIAQFFRDRGEDADGTEGDPRYEIREPSASVDLMMSFEIMQRIKDQVETSFEETEYFNESGVRTFAGEIVRVLKPGGVFVMTTPNPNSLLALERLRAFEPPVLFRAHVREYTREEVVEIFSPLRLLHYETQNSFFLFQRDPAEMEAAFTAAGWPTEHRGETHFCIFTKA